MTRLALLALTLLMTAPVAMASDHPDDTTTPTTQTDADGVEESVGVGWSATSILIAIVVALVVIALIAGLARRRRA